MENLEPSAQVSWKLKLFYTLDSNYPTWLPAQAHTTPQILVGSNGLYSPPLEKTAASLSIFPAQAFKSKGSP